MRRRIGKDTVKRHELIVYPISSCPLTVSFSIRRLNDLRVLLPPLPEALGLVQELPVLLASFGDGGRLSLLISILT